MQIIIIDDNPFDLNIISKIIERTFEIKTINFTSSKEAFRWVKSNEVDVVIVDCLMPSPNGIEFVYLLRNIKHFSEIPIIMVTSSVEKEIKYQALEIGVNFYINKPIDEMEFFVILNNAISMRQNQKRIREKEKELEESEEKFRVLTEKLPNMVLIFQDKKIIYANEMVEKKLGISKDELCSLSIAELINRHIYKDSIDRIKAVTEKILNGEDVPSQEYSIISRDKKVINTLISFCKFFYGGKKATLCIATDISEQKHAELAIKESQRRLSTLVNNLSGIAYRCKNDKNWTMEYISEGCFEITGYKPEDFVNNKTIAFADLIDKDYKEMVWEAIQKAIKRFEPYVIEYIIETKDKKKKWVWEKGIGVYDDDKNLIALEGFITDITERKEAEQRFEFMAHYDALTGLANRTLFFDRLNHAIKMAKRGMYMIALIYIDLDGFKFINDTYGHDVGDELLRQTANRIMDCVRESDTLARIGGDEFTVILSKIEHKKSATIVANKILRSISNPFYINGITCNISASLGISFYYTGDEDVDMLIKKADIAMYRSKQSGKNSYTLYSS